MGYQLVRHLARFLLTLFYRRVEVEGIAHIPARGSVIVAANHHNSIVDAMLLMAMVPRQLITLANAPLFRHPFIGPFLRLIRAIPVHRRQEGGNDPARNEAMFEAVIQTLREGGAILVFPEGVTQPEPILMPLRTGTARMLLGAAAGGGAAVTLLPVGLLWHEPGAFRAGSALMVMGKPVPTEDCVALYSTDPIAAVRQLTDRLTEALRQEIVEADDRQTLGLVRVVETMWREERSESHPDKRERIAWMQQVMRAYRYLLRRQPEIVAALRRRVGAYSRDLELAEVTDSQLSRSYPTGLVLRFALREGLSLLLGLPLAASGVAIHFVPYWLTGVVVRRLGRTAEEEATDKIAAGLVLYPLCWIVEGWTAFWLGGGWGLGIFVASLLPTGFFALAWRERLDRVRSESRAFFRFLVDRDLGRRLLTQRHALVAELTALAGLVPESVRLGQAKDESP